MKKIRWLHFSDIHLNKTGVETRRMRHALIPYLRKLQLQCDYVFFTGDIRYAPGGNQFTDAMAGQMKSICQAVNVTTDHLFVVPGNHDVDRAVGSRLEAIDRICLDKQAYYKPCEGQIREADLLAIETGQDAYREFLHDLFSENLDRVRYYDDPLHPHFCIQTDEFNIIHIDSTITYTEVHEQNLLIGTELFLDLMEQVDPDKITILLTHYSFDFLRRDEQNQVYSILKDYSAPIWIAGHEHDVLCRKQRDYFYEFQSGNLMLEQGAKSCFLIGTLDIDNGEGVIEAHAWFEGAGWEKYPFIRRGEMDNSIYPFSLQTVNRDFDVTDISEELAGGLHICQKLESPGGSFYGVTYDYALMPDLQDGQITYKNSGNTNPLLDAIDNLWRDKREQRRASCHALLLGDGGMGKSTMLFCACKELTAQQRLAVYIPLYILQMQNQSIKDYVVQALYGSSRGEERWNRLMDCDAVQPEITLLVDGFNELESQWAYCITNELRQLSVCRGVQIIISSRLDFLKYYGMTHFCMINTCDLRDEQIRGLFSETEWLEIKSREELHLLLKNPMMALLYAQVSPIVEKYRELDYFNWRIPVKNEVDLMHNYYMSQVALGLERSSNSAEKIFIYYCIIRYIMPYLAFRAELNGVMEYDKREFENVLKLALADCGERISDEQGMPYALDQIRKKYRLNGVNVPNVDSSYDVIVSELCLLREQGQVLRYKHQIYRDYEAAVYWYDGLCSHTVATPCWSQFKIHANVVSYLRDMSDLPWQAEGIADVELRPYRGVTIREGDHRVENILNCWLTKGKETDCERNLSELDLREISLAEALKNKYEGKINVDGAMVSRKTFVNEQRHDCIVGLAFSHDSRMLAAVSMNGVVSVCNIATQSQMIVGAFESSNSMHVYYTADDRLVFCTNGRLYLWTSIAYDRVEQVTEDKVPTPENYLSKRKKQADKLYHMLQDSDMLGSQTAISDEGGYLAVGYQNGHIQIWDSKLQIVVADFVLGDCQVQSASFSSNGEYLAVSSGGRLVQLWNLALKKCYGVIHFEQPICQVRFPATLGGKNNLVLECERPDGTCYSLDITTGIVEAHQNAQMELRIRKMLKKKLAGKSIRKIDIASNGNAVVLLNKSTTLYTWNHASQTLNECMGHETKVLDAAICKADPRYAAGYSDERIHAKGKMAYLNGQKVIRTRAVRKGNCMQRLTVGQRTIEKLQFFTTNRIILAAFATNGDILLWELTNRIEHGQERGHWDQIDIVKKNASIPLECAVSDKQKLFIGVHTDGKMFLRTFEGDRKTQFETFPGIDPTSLKWNDLRCEDDLKAILERYR